MKKSIFFILSIFFYISTHSAPIHTERLAADENDINGKLFAVKFLILHKISLLKSQIKTASSQNRPQLKRDLEAYNARLMECNFLRSDKGMHWINSIEIPRGYCFSLS